ncbi:MAG: YhcH/YjgK/YiaL family protein [Bacteroidales bacterium]|nr:YhcH/YjgK/YiaL family protein [Bacteroidales bacterium]
MKKILLPLTLAALCTCNTEKSGTNPFYDAFDAALFDGVDSEELRTQYEAARGEWDAALAFLQRSDLMTLPLGRHELTETGTYANIQEYDTDPAVQGKFEAHRAYVDIQVVLAGEEIIYVCDLADGREISMPYDAEKDCELFFHAVKAREVKVSPDCYVILFPNDGHMPGRPVDGTPCHVRKIVVKVPYVNHE